MHRPIRAVIYGFAIWWIWLAVLGLSRLLPDAITAAPSYPLARLLVLVVLVVGFAVDYLRRVERSGVREGLVVGLLWWALMIANDIGHFAFMDPTADIGRYLAVSAPLYVFIPLVTTVLFGGLVARPRANG